MKQQSINWIYLGNSKTEFEPISYEMIKEYIVDYTLLISKQTGIKCDTLVEALYDHNLNFYEGLELIFSQNAFYPKNSKLLNFILGLYSIPNKIIIENVSVEKLISALIH